MLEGIKNLLTFKKDQNNTISIDLGFLDILEVDIIQEVKNQNLSSIDQEENEKLTTNLIAKKIKSKYNAKFRETKQKYISQYIQDFTKYKSLLSVVTGLIDEYKTNCNLLDKLGIQVIQDYNKEDFNKYDDFYKSIEMEVLSLHEIPTNIQMDSE